MSESMKTFSRRVETPAIFLAKLAIFALVLRFCIGAAYYAVFIEGLKKPLYAFDGEAYSILGWYIALVLKGVNVATLPASLIPVDYVSIAGFFGTVANYQGALPPLKAYGVGVYAYLIGAFYYLFGYAPVLLRLLNSAIGVASAFLTYVLAKRNFGEGAARISFVAMLFIPSLVIYSASLQRDPLINFLTLLVMCLIAFLAREARPRRAIVAALFLLAGLAALFFLRRNTMFVLCLCILVVIYIRLLSRFRWTTFLGTVLLLCLPAARERIFSLLRSKTDLMLNYHLGLTNLGGYVFKLLPEHYYKLDQIDSGLVYTHIALGDLVSAYFQAIKMFILQPFFPGFHKAQHLLILPQMIVWYFLVICAVIGIVAAFRSMNAERASLLVLLLVFTSAIGLSEANVETLLRHRDMIIPVYIIFAAYGIERLAGRKH